MNKEKILFASSFILKIIAIVSMTFDHIGLVLSLLYPSMPGLNTIYPTFRIIGRIALPLFCFMIVEGAVHSKNISKYFIRLSIIAVVVAVAEIVLEYVPAFGMSGYVREQGNIFIDLLTGALAVYGLKSKGIAKKFLVLPCLFVGIASYVCYSLESINSYHILWYPFFLRSQYHIVSMFLIFGFYGSRMLVSSVFQNMYHVGLHDLDDTVNWRLYVNLFSALVVACVAFGLHAVATYGNAHSIFWLKEYQTWMLLSIIAILFYNGKRGYNKKWFQYSSYLYYPLHIPLIYGIVYLITKVFFGG